MKRVQGDPDVALLECTNPVRNKWRVRSGDVSVDESGITSYMEEEFNHKPSEEEIKSIISGWINAPDRFPDSLRLSITMAKWCGSPPKISLTTRPLTTSRFRLTERHCP